MKTTSALQDHHFAWIDQQRHQLGAHVRQCGTGLRGGVASGLEAVHRALNGRFLTTVCAVAAVMWLPAVWL
jgi:hypothetical protein